MSALLLMDGTRDETSSTSNKPVVVSYFRVHVVIRLVYIEIKPCMCISLAHPARWIGARAKGALINGLVCLALCTRVNNYGYDVTISIVFHSFRSIDSYNKHAWLSNIFGKQA